MKIQEQSVLEKNWSPSPIFALVHASSCPGYILSFTHSSTRTSNGAVMNSAGEWPFPLRKPRHGRLSHGVIRLYLKKHQIF